MSTPGILTDLDLAALVSAGGIVAPDIEDGQIQPASLDLRLGTKAYRLRASFLPGPARTVDDCLASGLVMHEIELTGGAVLETGCVYLVPLMESLALPAGLSAAMNPKSSTGRLDVFTRVIGNNAAAFDQLPAGYCGPLWVEISPRTFSILARPGDRLVESELADWCRCACAAARSKPDFHKCLALICRRQVTRLSAGGPSATARWWIYAGSARMPRWISGNRYTPHAGRSCSIRGSSTFSPHARR